MIFDEGEAAVRLEFTEFFGREFSNVSRFLLRARGGSAAEHAVQGRSVGRRVSPETRRMRRPSPVALVVSIVVALGLGAACWPLAGPASAAVAAAPAPTEPDGTDGTPAPDPADEPPQSIVALSVDPVDSVVGVGATRAFVARGLGPKGEDLGDVTRRTAFSIAKPASCDGPNCGSDEPGTYPVLAVVQTGDREVVGQTRLTVVRVEGLRLQPGDSSTKAGESQTYTVRGFRRLSESKLRGRVDQDLGDLTARTVFSIDPPGSCTRVASCSAEKAGTYTVIGAVAGVPRPGRARLKVLPNDPVTLRLSPPTATISVGARQAYRADSIDRYQNVVAEVTERTVFTIPPSGSCDVAWCTADQPGTYPVAGEMAGTGIRGAALLTVEPIKPVGLELKPAAASILVGASQTYTARGIGPRDRDLGDVTGRTVLTISSPGACSGSTCTAPERGTYQVTGRIVGTEVSSTATLEVVDPPLERVVLDPPVTSIAAGGSRTYHATGFDARGRQLGDLTARTTFSIDGSGSCAAASCGADRTGRYTVTGHVIGSTVSGTARLAVHPATLDRLVIDPVTASVSAGAARAYSARGFDAFGNDLGELTRDTIFSIAPGGSCTGVRCSADETGTYTVTGAVVGSRVTATAELRVLPARLDALVLDPPAASVAVGAWQTYRARGFDRFGNDVGDVTGRTVLTIGSGGSCTETRCTAAVAGDYTVFAEVVGAAVRATSRLHATAGAPVEIVLDPAAASITAGASQTYRVSGFDRFGNALGDVTARTTFSVEPAGSCARASCSARTPGDHTVTASLARSAATGRARLTVTAGAPAQVVLDPAVASVTAGASQTYRALGYDTFGNEVGDLTRRTVFSIGPGGSCDGAACSASGPGDYTVTGRVVGTAASDQATLHVAGRGPVPEPPAQRPVARLRLDPPVKSIAAGSSQTYRARAFDPKGADLGDVTAQTTFSIEPEGSCAGATCNAEEAGTHAVVGAFSGIHGEARLDVVASRRLADIVLDPAIGSIGVRAVQAYRAWGFDGSGNELGEVTDRTTFSVEPAGTCAAAGCTADRPGTYVVTARVPGTRVSARATLQVVPAELAQLVLDPAGGTIRAGSSQAYRTRGYDASGFELGDLTARTTFGIRPSGSCTASICTVPVPGDYTVTGSVAGTPPRPAVVASVPLRVTTLQPVAARRALPWLLIAVGAVLFLSGGAVVSRAWPPSGRPVAVQPQPEPDDGQDHVAEQVRVAHRVAGRVEVVERSGAPPSWTVRLEPHTDNQGTQSVPKGEGAQ